MQQAFFKNMNFLLTPIFWTEVFDYVFFAW